MNWQAVTDAFEKARRLPPGERMHFLREYCAADDEIRQEAESLIESYDDSGTFLESPALELGSTELLETITDRLIGARLGAYLITRRIGEGGMGTVYEATRADGEFRHKVAIKIVREDWPDRRRHERFRAERQILADLSHPHIARLLDGGATEDHAPYLVMELIEGDPIDCYCDSRGVVLAGLLELFVKVCEAVEYANRHHVIHCDIKPGNILVTSDGTPKLLDFGISKLLAGAPHTTLSLGRVATPEYASPEQLSGGRVTAATDVYSLGAVLRTLTAGLPGVPPALFKVIAKATHPQPTERYASAAELGEAARTAARKGFVTPRAGSVRRRSLLVAWLALALTVACVLAVWFVFLRKPAATLPRSVAVLPFENLSSDHENEYFSRGLTEEILGALANVPGLKVVARTSTFQFKGTHLDVRLLGKLLNVETVLEGSVRKDGSRIRITPQLIDAATGYHQWSMEFDRELQDILGVQKEIAAAVAAAVKGRYIQPPSPQPGPFVVALTTNADFKNPVCQIGKLDLGRGTFRSEATLSRRAVGFGKDREGQLYAVDYKNDLVRIDPLTGGSTVIGSTGLSKPGPPGPAVDVFTSMANGEFYLMDYDNVLYSVDKSTGHVKRIGSTGIPLLTNEHFGTSFAGDCDSLYFTIEEDDNKGNILIPATLYKIDPRTALTTRVGSTASFMGGSGFLGKTLYGFKIDENLIGGKSGPQVLVIDVKTGAAHKVSSLNVPSVFGTVSIGEERSCSGQ